MRTRLGQQAAGGAIRLGLAALTMTAWTGCVVADQAGADLSRPTLPTFATVAPPTDPSPWTGLYVGSEVFAFSGSKGIRGGFGGDGFAGYDHELSNGIVLGIQGSLGYAPAFFKQSRASGYEFGQTEVRVGYDMGRFMPFVTAGVGLAQPNLRGAGFGGATNVANDLFNTSGDLRSFESAGVGFAYQITPRLSVEMQVQAFRGNGLVVP